MSAVLSSSARSTSRSRSTYNQYVRHFCYLLRDCTRRHQMRRPPKDQLPAHNEIPDKLPGDANDLTLAELQEMASRQQQQMEAQQQVLVAKEQRLKYLKQQEARHAQLASESERLRKIRERVESQELKLKKLRALKGQAEQHRSNNSNLNTELDAVKAVFNEKEKELAIAVARVDQLTRQLRDLRNGVNLNLTGNQQAAAMAELEKLRKELLIRNKLNEQQSNSILAKEKLLSQRKEEVARMDMRIQELQQRLKKKKSQELANAQNKVSNVLPSNKLSGQNVEQYGQYSPQNQLTGGQTKQDFHYQNVKINVSGKPEFDNKFSKTLEMNNNNEAVEEYKLPTVLPMDSSSTKMKGSYLAPSISKQQSSVQPPIPARNNSFGKANIDYVRPAAEPTSQHNYPLRKEARPLPVIAGKPAIAGQKFVPLPPPRQPVSSGAAGDTGKQLPNIQSSVPAMPGTSLHPVININEEERQAGSGQSSPASSEASNSSTVVKGDEVNTSSIGPVSALIERLNKNLGQPPDQTNISSQGSAGLARPNLRGRQTSLESNVQGPVSERQQSTHQTSTNGSSLSQSSQVSSPGAEDSNSARPLHSSNLHLNQKPAPTYRYASKNQIANTYMGRLGSAAMEKYQRTLNMLYNNIEREERKTDPGADREGTTSFVHASSVEPPVAIETISSHNYPDIASDKGSYKLNTPKHIRRRHSDSENEDLNKALQEHQELEQQQRLTGHQQPLSSDNTASEQSAEVSSPVQPDKPNLVPTSPDKNLTSPLKEDKVPESPTPKLPASPPPLPAVKSSPSKAEMVVRRGKSNLKQEGSRKSNNRVSFDPLALLLDASLEGELELVKKVAVQVEDVSTPNDEGITALHNAICAGHLDIVKFLVEFGCDVNSPDSDGWTPLHCAASCNNLAMVKFLVEHGACVFATTISDQETAADKCEEEEDGYDGCSDYLYSIQEKMGIINNGEVYGVFDYQATNTDELSFQAGDKLTVLRKGDDVEKEWWWSRLDGNEGYIPRNLLGLYPRVSPQPREVSEC
ncbi:apoptosis-stimulating of p53 protein 1-like isoform X4 [Biomphalaria glabrata]|uniref:Apoptosis-stimulating of p53 protein 1-like isoform X4 n=1 Tax=Biomphalaria glabrata TaxID=6526 RepID=A0A9W2ZYI6_BIOGL|nr:apoptosis-stimulating of p53 protein 1-like isoform X4 [Biomphalaria glabrata]